MAAVTAPSLVRTPARAGRVGHGAGLWVVAAVFLIAMAFSVLPTPLWALYQRRLGLSALAITEAFAAYALGVAVSLLLIGHVSDWVGRRRVLVAGMLVESLAAGVFLALPTLPGLVLARFASGVGVGMISATATAHIVELHAAARPGVSRARSDLIATVVTMAGFAVGPLAAGVMAQFGAAPLRLPFEGWLVLMLAGAGALLLVPETVEVRHRRYRPQRVSVPAQARRRYLAASAAGFAAFSVTGLFTSLAPGFVAGTLGHPSRLLAGAIASLIFAAGALAQVAMHRAAGPRQLVRGQLLVVLGLPLVAAGMDADSLVVFLLGGALAGAGAGALLKGAVGTGGALAPAGSRGEALAGVFLAAYLGLGVSSLGLGTATRWVSDQVALTGFVVFVLAVLALVTVLLGPAARLGRA